MDVLYNIQAVVIECALLSVHLQCNLNTTI